MKTVAFKMKLKPGNEAEYKKRHDEIWPELESLLKENGITDYHIFLDEESLSLFAVQKLKENSTEAELPKHALMKKWWEYMADLMEVNPDHSPVVIPLEKVFYMK
ncbi:L-rhamnose mutarotase [Mesonia aestuariivivens]|uniref:L-rhamnose mutarotase n=1 Tax=Mesonia aestuariivivens TaxID=2796128 RepID=A0ABS6W675_9FLAO|nr:L-rhamnose mutarotase [Mesonia aestuariivivens]MBW2962623.1 L-rhamnose mutarotase [Mesonia aestuariivivens]